MSLLSFSHTPFPSVSPCKASSAYSLAPSVWHSIAEMSGSTGEGRFRSALSNLTPAKKEPLKGVVNGPFVTKTRRHITNERQRRLHMNTLLESLQELLPDPSPRKDRYSLLVDAIDYVKSLEEKSQELATCKETISSSLSQAKTFAKTRKLVTLATTSHVVTLQNLHVQVFKSLKPMIDDREEIIITFTCGQEKGLFSQILKLFDINQIEIINATFSTTPDDQMLHFIHAKVRKDLDLQTNDLEALLSNSYDVKDEEHIAKIFDKQDKKDVLTLQTSVDEPKN